MVRTCATGGDQTPAPHARAVRGGGRGRGRERTHGAARAPTRAATKEPPVVPSRAQASDTPTATTTPAGLIQVVPTTSQIGEGTQTSAAPTLEQRVRIGQVPGVMATQPVVLVQQVLKVRNIFPTTLEKSSMDVLEFFYDKLKENATVRDDCVHERGDDDFQSPPHLPPKVYIKPNLEDAPGSMDLLAEVKCLSNSQKELKEEFQMIKKELQMLNVFIVESNSKLVNDVESLSKKVDISSASEHEGRLCKRGMYVGSDFDGLHDKENVDCGYNETYRFDNNIEKNEAPNDELGVYQDADFGAGETAIDPMEAYYINVPESQIVKYRNPAIAAKDPTDECYVNVPESRIFKYTNPVASEHTPEYSKRERRPASVYKSPFLTDFSSGASSVRGSSMKTIVTRGHPFVCFTSDDDYNKITSEFKTRVAPGLRTKRKTCVYAKKDNTLQPMFEFGVLHVGKKEWFHKLAYKSQSISDSHADVLFYYLRKRGKYDPNVDIKLTSTDYLFDLKIKALYKKFIAHNNNSIILKHEHDIARYILGDEMLCDSPWHIVDHILFPINVVYNDYWVLAVMSFKEKCIFLFDSKEDASHKSKIRKAVDAYAVIIPYFLCALGFYGKRNDIELKKGSYKDKTKEEPFDVVMIDGLPMQQDTESGVLVAIFAESFICGQSASKNVCDITAQRIRYGFLLLFVSENHFLMRLIEPPDLWAYWIIVLKLNFNNSP
uniref:Uncharacterized protein LOC104211613 n=1 Tax=Nicotiana sylvestris TaxID=4096 RepID=A0A1U7USF5_NICSY|nr:PREDICTED: uncharacterized protein LOC104211613 [Nicotiana sylvestris]